MNQEYTKEEGGRNTADDPKGSDKDRQPEVYFGHGYGGFYPTFGYWSVNSSRFERGFNYNIFGDPAGERSWWRRTYDWITRRYRTKVKVRRRTKKRRTDL